MLEKDERAAWLEGVQLLNTNSSVDLHTHTRKEEGREGKNGREGGDMQYPSYSPQKTKQRDKGDFSEVQYEHQYRAALDGWMDEASCKSQPEPQRSLPHSSSTHWSTRSISHHNDFLTKKVLHEEKQISKGKNFFISALTWIFPQCKQAWTWGDIQISVLRSWRAVCLYKAVFRLKLYDLLIYTSLKITFSTCFLAWFKLLQ